MTHVITVPPSLDDHSFEQVLEQVAPLAPDEKILVDARHARWASPYGLTALLTLAQTRTERPSFAVPEQEETASYWARAAFFQHAEALYDLHGSYPKRRSDSESSSEGRSVVFSSAASHISRRPFQRVSSHSSK